MALANYQIYHRLYLVIDPFHCVLEFGSYLTGGLTIWHQSMLLALSHGTILIMSRDHLFSPVQFKLFQYLLCLVSLYLISYLLPRYLASGFGANLRSIHLCSLCWQPTLWLVL